MFHYFFKNVNTLFLTCALAFISIANAQRVITVDNKGSMDTIIKPTIAERYASNVIVDISTDPAGKRIYFNMTSPGTASGLLDENYANFYRDIRIKKAGTFRVSYRITAALTLTPSCASEYIIAKCLAPCTGSYLPVNGTKSVLSFKAVGQGTGTVSASRILKLGVGDKLGIIGRTYAAPGDPLGLITTIANGSSFLVERIK